VCLSIGIEHIDNILSDLHQALVASSRITRAAA
jgi:O-acetylhomoserine/O-acetylserine sulfhydrylase-like pyridoxal-dependent enzyme